MTTPAPQGGAGSDEPIGLDLGQVRPIGYLDRGIVRTSFSNGQRIQFCPTSRCSRSRSRRAASSSRARSTRSPTASCGSAAGRQPAAQSRAEATPCGSTRPAEPHPTGRQRVRGKAQSRLIDSQSQTTAAVGRRV